VVLPSVSERAYFVEKTVGLDFEASTREPIEGTLWAKVYADLRFRIPKNFLRCACGLLCFAPCMIRFLVGWTFPTIPVYVHVLFTAASCMFYSLYNRRRIFRETSRLQTYAYKLAKQSSLLKIGGKFQKHFFEESLVIYCCRVVAFFVGRRQRERRAESLQRRF
jgi:hypothetical protein